MWQYNFMNLTDALKFKEMTIYDLAKRVDVHYTHILRIVHGKRRPSPELAQEIEEAMDNVVTRMELLYPKKRRAEA